jgi:hypothetical protein
MDRPQVVTEQDGDEPEQPAADWKGDEAGGEVRALVEAAAPGCARRLGARRPGFHGGGRRGLGERSGAHRDRRRAGRGVGERCGAGPCGDLLAEPRPNSPAILQARYPNPNEPDHVKLTWLDTSTNEDGFAISAMDADGTFDVVMLVQAHDGTEPVFYDDEDVVDGETISYVVQAFLDGAKERRFSKHSNITWARTH